MLPDLCLAPHEVGELPPGEPLCAPAECRVRIWKWRGGGSYLFRFMTRGNGKKMFVARRERLVGSPWASPLLRFHLMDEVAEAKLCLQGDYFERVLLFRSDRRLATSPDDWQFCIKIDAVGVAWHQLRDRESFSFAWKGFEVNQCLDRAWRMNTSDAQVERDVKQMLADSSCDLAFVNRWANLSEQEKSRYLFLVAKGTLDLCQSVLRDVLWSDAACLKEDAWKWSIYMGSLDCAPVSVWYLYTCLLESGIQNKNKERKLSNRQRYLLKLVVQHFGLHRNAEALNRNSIRHDWLHNGCDWEFTVPIPTAHERLEAGLRLREWLCDKVSPSKLAELVGKS